MSRILICTTDATKNYPTDCVVVCTSPDEHHRTAPTGYNEYLEWCEEMDKTHVQSRCSGCGLWVIWTPRPQKVWRFPALPAASPGGPQ